MKQGNEAEQGGGQGGWLSFLQEPAAYADPEHLALCFDRKVSRTACERLLSNNRLRERLSMLLAERYELAVLPDESMQLVDDLDRTIALSSVDRLNDIILRAGGIYWSGVLAGTILGRNAAAMRAVLNGEVIAFAVANRDLAGPHQPIEPIDTLGDRIEADGWRCLAAWCHAIDPAISARFRLKLPPFAPLEEVPTVPFVEIGPEILRRAAR